MLTSALRRAARVRPAGLAIVSGRERRTWPEVAKRVSSLAGALRAAGLQPGERVATLALNAPRYFELLLAVWWAGGVLVPLNTRLAVDEITFILQHSEASLLVTDEAFAHFRDRDLRSLLALREVVVLSEGTYESMIGHASIEDACRPLHELAGIFYTGGTTGIPKGVELTHLNFSFAAMNMQRDLGHDESTVYLHAAPLFHLADFGIGLGVTLGTGGHSFISHFTPADFYERLREDGVTHLQLVPTMLAMVLEAPERDDRLLEQIRSIAYGAAPISQALLSRLVDAFPNAGIRQFYGMTECCGASVTLGPERHVIDGPLAGKLEAAGQAAGCFEIRIANDLQETCPTGEVGEIQMRGPALMRGYWKDPQETAKTLVGGWLRSGDAGRMDDEGFVYVVDRIKDMIISGGENIYCAEVESALSTCPGVERCAVIGLPDERWGERVHAVVVCRDGQRPLAADLDSHCRARIAGYKVPRSYDIRTQELPLSAVGKVMKTRLRDEWMAAMGNRK